MENRQHIQDWISRLTVFFELLRAKNCYVSSFSIEKRDSFELPPGSKLKYQGASRLESFIGAWIPNSLKDFYRFGATSINCQFHFQQALFGGPRFWSEFELPYAIHQLRFGASGFRSIDLSITRQLNNCFPLTLLSNDDLLLLNTGDCYDNPPVAYFSFATCFFRNISPDFLSFLLEWERVHYVDPTFWEELGLIEESSGFLSSAQANKMSSSQNYKARAFQELNRVLEGRREM